MGRTHKPLDQLSPASVEHNKGRVLDRLKAPKTVGQVGNPPKWMNKQEKKIWAQLKKSAPGVLGENDRCLMEITVTLKAKLENRTITNSELSTLIGCLKQLGFIVLDRQPVAQEKPEADKWEALGV